MNWAGAIWGIGKFNFVNYHWLVWYHCSTDAMMHSSWASLRRWTGANQAVWCLSGCRICSRSSRALLDRWRCLSWKLSAVPIAPAFETWRDGSGTRPAKEKGGNNCTLIWFDCENLINALSGTSIGTSGAVFVWWAGRRAVCALTKCATAKKASERNSIYTKCIWMQRCSWSEGLGVTIVFIINDPLPHLGLTEINWSSQKRLFRIIFSLFLVIKNISVLNEFFCVFWPMTLRG